MHEDVNTGDNLRAQVDRFPGDGDEYHFPVIATGGGPKARAKAS